MAAALAFTLVATSMPRARAAELPAGFQPPREYIESYNLTVAVKDETGVAFPRSTS